MKKFIFYATFLVIGQDDVVPEKICVPYEVAGCTYDAAVEKALMQAQATVRAYEADHRIAYFRLTRKAE